MYNIFWKNQKLLDKKCPVIFSLENISNKCGRGNQKSAQIITSDSRRGEIR